jgi:DNA-directed RNA polymerase subunit E"
MITSKERCPVCKNPTSSNWSGLVIITDPENSDVAKELNVTLKGEYALRVR